MNGTRQPRTQRPEWVCPEEKKTRKLRSPPNITSWRDFVSVEEIVQFLSRSFSTVRSSGSTVKQPS
jgi:hypothetical protein